MVLLFILLGNFLCETTQNITKIPSSSHNSQITNLSNLSDYQPNPFTTGPRFSPTTETWTFFVNDWFSRTIFIKGFLNETHWSPLGGVSTSTCWLIHTESHGSVLETHWKWNTSGWSGVCLCESGLDSVFIQTELQKSHTNWFVLNEKKKNPPTWLYILTCTECSGTKWKCLQFLPGYNYNDLTFFIGEVDLWFLWDLNCYTSVLAKMRYGT